jgi:hypothetical protein
MSAVRTAMLMCEAWVQIVRVGAALRRHGFSGATALLAPAHDPGRDDASLTAAIGNAVALAGCCYWRPVLCLHRSIALVGVMRRHGLRARLVVAYRPAPFTAHAWVEVDGRVVNDSQEYANRLQVLLTA